MGDTGYQNFTKVLPDGTTEFSFPGGFHIPIDTLGVDAFPNPGTDAGLWNLKTSGATVAQILGSYQRGRSGGFNAVLNLSANDPSSGKGSGITISAGKNTRVDVGAGAASKKLLAEDGTSDWLLRGDTSVLQLAASALGLKAACGIGNITFPAGSVWSDGADGDITHDLGVVPQILLMSGLNSSDLYYGIAPLGASAWDATTATFTAQIVSDVEDPGVSGNYQFSWLALG